MAIAVGDRFGNTCQDLCITGSCVCGANSQQAVASYSNSKGTITIIAGERQGWMLQSLSQARPGKYNSFHNHGAYHGH